jgi:adenylate kinase family enzyme
MSGLTRVTVVGTSGAGKTTFASELAALLGTPHVELDALYWGPNWRPRDDFVERVRAVAAQPAWVADGNFAAARAVLWPRSDSVIWLDYSFALTFGRALRRTAARVVRRQALWADNRESIWRVLFNTDTVLWWVIRTHARKRREIAKLMADPANAHIRFLVLRTPDDAIAFLHQLRAARDRREEPGLGASRRPVATCNRR